MDIDTGRALYKEIMQSAREASRLHGSPNRLLPGTMRDAALQKHKVLGVFEDFDEWWSRVHTLGLRPYPGSASAVTASANGAKPKSSAMPKMTLIERYRTLVGKYDALPLDEFLAEEWGCDPATPGRMRSKLKRNGFVFVKRAGVWHVTKRPEPVKLAGSTLEPSPWVEPDWLKEAPSVTAPVSSMSLEAVPDTAILARLDEITRLLRELVSVWM